MSELWGTPPETVDSTQISRLWIRVLIASSIGGTFLLVHRTAALALPDHRGRFRPARVFPGKGDRDAVVGLLPEDQPGSLAGEQRRGLGHGRQIHPFLDEAGAGKFPEAAAD